MSPLVSYSLPPISLLNSPVAPRAAFIAPLPTPSATPAPPVLAVGSEEYDIERLSSALSSLIPGVANHLATKSGVRRRGLATLSSPAVLSEFTQELEAMMCMQKIAARAEAGIGL